MSLKRICGLAITVALTGVASGAPLAIHATGALPFTTAELEAALALRAGLATSSTGPQLVAAVSAVPDVTRIRVAVAGRQRDVALDGQGGVDAARLVAFAILDLAGDQLDPPGDRAAPLPRVAAREAPVAIHTTPIARPSAPIVYSLYEPRWSLGVWGTTGSQVGGKLDGIVELGIPIADALRATISAGWSARAPLAASASLRTIPLRAGLAWRRIRLPLGALELRADAIGMIADASAVRSDTSLVLGGGAALVWAVPVLGDARGVTLLVGGGVDVFATARDYRVDGMAAGATDRVAAWAGVGLAGEVWR